MASELKRIEKNVNRFVGKPLSWSVYALLLTAKYSIRSLARCATWVRRRYAASSGRA